jgi:ribonuclease P protein component
VRKNAIIKRSSEIKTILRTGNYVNSAYFKIVYQKTKGPESRSAILIGKKYGKAVERNRMKRRLREILRSIVPRLLVDLDLLIIPRKTREEILFHLLQDRVYLSLKMEGLLKDVSP